MNSVFKITGLVALTCGLVACGGDIEDKTTAPQNYHDITANLQGTVFNAVTGERISNDNLSVVLIQGDRYREAKLNRDYPGDYFIGDIPASTNGNVTFRIDAKAAGYQPVSSRITFDINTDDLQDRKTWNLGNFYLYPLGTTAPDMNIEVFYEGERVEGAEVLLQPETASNVLTTDSSSVISPTLGYQKALSVTTDADGNATFAGTSLVLGGRYKVQVLPTTYKGIQLGLKNNGTTVTVGTSTIRQRVDMAHILPANDNGLYVVSASNENFDGINSSGKLTIQLNRPVSIVNESLVSASLTNATTAALDTNSPGSDVTATVSTDGLTITLTPNFATNPVTFNGNNSGTADNGLTVTFANLFIRLQDSNDSSLFEVFDALNGLVGTDGQVVNDTVQITPEF